MVEFLQLTQKRKQTLQVRFEARRRVRSYICGGAWVCLQNRYSLSDTWWWNPRYLSRCPYCTPHPFCGLGSPCSSNENICAQQGVLKHKHYPSNSVLPTRVRDYMWLPREHVRCFMENFEHAQLKLLCTFMKETGATNKFIGGKKTQVPISWVWERCHHNLYCSNMWAPYPPTPLRITSVAILVRSKMWCMSYELHFLLTSNLAPASRTALCPFRI